MEKKYYDYNDIHQLLFVPDTDGDPWSGIFTYFRSVKGGNPVTLNEMTVTKSSQLAGVPKELLDISSSDNNWTNEEVDSHIVFRFLSNPFHMTHYRIRSVHFDEDWAHLKNWAMEVSNDGVSYTIIDQRTDDNHLNGSGNEFTFECNRPLEDSFSYFRLRLTGPNHRNNNGLGLRRIEFYGDCASF